MNGIKSPRHFVYQNDGFYVLTNRNVIKMQVVRPVVHPVVISTSLKEQTYEALKRAITSMNIYAQLEAPKLDERHLAKSLGVSRTPAREALARLEQEGLVQTIRRRGVFVVRKTKNEIIEIVTAWVALESMAASIHPFMRTNPSGSEIPVGSTTNSIDQNARGIR